MKFCSSGITTSAERAVFSSQKKHEVHNYSKRKHLCFKSAQSNIVKQQRRSRFKGRIVKGIKEHAHKRWGVRGQATTFGSQDHG
ncbi:hypothetical protein HI914_03955 [Erysiphe necator]|nr:hypothetical protein HI914_03955 [Erysiphe necator]